MRFVIAITALKKSTKMTFFPFKNMVNLTQSKKELQHYISLPVQKFSQTSRLAAAHKFHQAPPPSPFSPPPATGARKGARLFIERGGGDLSRDGE